MAGPRDWRSHGKGLGGVRGIQNIEIKYPVRAGIEQYLLDAGARMTVIEQQAVPPCSF